MIRTADQKSAIGISRNHDGQVYLALARREPNRKMLAVPITDIEAREIINELSFEFALYPKKDPWWKRLLDWYMGPVEMPQ